MKEKLYTIPLNDAVNAEDECPFCFIERSVEQDLLDFALGSGSSYMESDVREATDKAGFCREHFKKMFHYGNTLGNGWILKTHFIQMNKELEEQVKLYQSNKPSKSGLFKKSLGQQTSMGLWIQDKKESCYICNQYKQTYNRYMDTFFVMYKKDAQFREKVNHSKGFCMIHFGDLWEYAQQTLNDKEKEELLPPLLTLMQENMKRLGEEVSWLVEKFDYRNKDADWKNSKDSIQRGMQKLKGGYPSADYYKMDK